MFSLLLFLTADLPTVFPPVCGPSGVQRWLFLLQSSLYLERGFDLYFHFFDDPLRRGFSLNCIIISHLPENSTSPPNLTFPNSYLSWSLHPTSADTWEFRDIAKVLYSFEYALTETSAHWIYRGYDDIQINFDLLWEYLSVLDRQYDPLKTFVVRGECIINDVVYRQGGGGMIHSRRALEVIVRMAYRILWEMQGIWDDQRFGYVLQDLNWSAGECSSSAFLGTPFEIEDWHRVESDNFSDLPECPAPVEWDLGCRRFLLSVRQLVFFHTGKNASGDQGSMEERLKMAKNLWKAEPEIAVHRSGWNGVFLCHWSEAGTFNGTFNYP